MSEDEELGGNFGPSLLQTPLLEKYNQRDNHVRGFMFVALSAVVFSLNTLLSTEILRGGVQPFCVLVFRGVVQFVVAHIFLPVLKINFVQSLDFYPNLFLHLNGISVTIGIAFLYIGLVKLEMSDATVFFFTSPVYATIFSFLMLGEPIRVGSIFAFFLALGGALLTSRPSFLFHQEGLHSLPFFSVVITILGAVSMGFSYVCARILHVKTSANPIACVYYSALYSAVLPLLAFFFLNSPPFPKTYPPFFYILGIGLCSFFGQVLLNIGFSLAPVGPASLIRNLDVALVFLMQLALNDRSVSWTSCAGAALVVAASMLIIRTNR